MKKDETRTNSHEDTKNTKNSILYKIASCAFVFFVSFVAPCLAPCLHSASMMRFACQM